jgi:hypothetical protein
MNPANNSERLVDVYVPVREGTEFFSEVLTLANQLGINLSDIEVSHLLDTGRGTLVLTLSALSAPTFVDSLSDRGYEPSLHERPD